MPIWLALLMFAAGIVLVIKGGDWFVDAAGWIARVAGIPPFIIGATIVSVATTLPEMIVSIIAAANGKADMAVGNAVGSVTCNTAMILAIAMIFMHVTVNRKKYMKQCLLLIGAAAVLYVGSLKNALSVWASALLGCIFVVFMVINVSAARQDMEEYHAEEANKKLVAKNIVMFLLGAAAIVAGSELLVNGGAALAAQLGVPERVIGVTLVAVGTSLPELVTTLTAIRKRESGLSIGNIVGANIIDLTLILPICSIVSGQPLPVSAQCVGIDMLACLAVLLLALVPMLIRQKAPKLLGVLCLAAYGGYLFITI